MNYDDYVKDYEKNTEEYNKQLIEDDGDEEK